MRSAPDVCPPGPISVTTPPVEAALARGTSLGRFVVLSLVGRGAMGEVYGAYDPELDRKVAIKLVRARGRSGDTADSRTRLMREAQATAKVAHPNVVVVYDAGTFKDRVFIAMEFVEGHTLRYWLQAASRTWPEVLEIFTAAGRGLVAAHEKELVHRDFKPDNVMVGADGQVRVMDFGLARLASDRGSGPVPISVSVRPAARGGRASRQVEADFGQDDLESTRDLGSAELMSTIGGSAQMLKRDITKTGAMLGTPAYMSPEQFRKEAADARSDQFSFCVALYEAVYGDKPFPGRTLDELAGNVMEGRLSPPPADTKVPVWIHKVLQRGLRVNPDERFPSMSALLAELDAKPAVAHRMGFASGAAAKLAGVWEAPVAGHPVETPEKAEMREAFLATGKVYAAASFAGASGVLDRYAQRWSEIYVEVCEATHVRGEQSAEVLDLRMDCLTEGLDDLKALCRLFRKATGEVVENAVNAANALGTLERCQDVKLLRAIVRPPDDAATRAAVEQLRARLVEVRALSRVGRLVDGMDAALPLVEEARRTGYGPMLAEVLLVLGLLQIDGGNVDGAVKSMDEAVWTAELARHDEVAAAAASNLIYLCGYTQSRLDAAEIWSRHAETLLRRMGGHDQIWGWFFNNRAAMREAEGRLSDAIQDSRLAVAAKERALGADHPDLGSTIGNLANQLAGLGDFAQAIEASQRAVEIVEAGLGPDHPRTSVVLSNHGEFLCRLGRFREARAVAERALKIFERETDPKGAWVTFPLLTLGLSHLGVGLFEEAVLVLERAARIREDIEKTPLRLGEVHFALARALWEGRGDQARARELAARARQEYQQAPATPAVKLDLAELDRWLAAHA
jgi:tRNA A-37 threonylcarbamoyl transferase component Bud32/tetratricopeptide (TPR) repeat protein